MPETNTALLFSGSNTLDVNESAILKTIFYFDIFGHPLRQQEIHRYCTILLTSAQLVAALESLLGKRLITKQSDLFFLTDRDIYKAQLRTVNAIRAEKKMWKARLFSKIISKFPYVRAVFISGSLSKGVLSKKGDVDYFIVTTAGRLWLSRMLLVLFKRIFLFNSHKYFCINYFVDDQNLEIPDKNIFTAVEIASLLPVINKNLYNKFLDSNSWIYEYLPNTILKSDHCPPYKTGFFKTIFEKIFSGNAGNYLENQSMQKTFSYWKKKYRSNIFIEFDDSIRIKPGVAKYHPNNFQDKVLNRLNEKIAGFETETGFSLHEPEKEFV